MSHRKALALAVLYVVLLSLFVGPAWTVDLPQPGICLYRDPAPPNKVLNDGTGVITFCWTIDFATECNQNYILEILPPGSEPAFTLDTFNCEPSPINRCTSWTVPADTSPGCYYARLTFYSDWCFGGTNKAEDRASVGFIVAPAARFKICKFWDVNGNGERDDGEPGLAGWTFSVELPDGTPLANATTDQDGCTPEISVPVEPTGETQVLIREEERAGWVKTTPNGSDNPITVYLTPGANCDITFGNWQPITITGNKFMDTAPWPWLVQHYIGTQGQQNSADFEPVPECIDPLLPPIVETQPNPTGIEGLVIGLYGEDGTTLLGTALTGPDGSFSFGPLQYQSKFTLKEIELPTAASTCDPLTPDLQLCEDHQFVSWPGTFVGTVSMSPWNFAEPGVCGLVSFDVPDTLLISPPDPGLFGGEFGDNNFYNQCPSRLWGVICPQARDIEPCEIQIQKDGMTWEGGAASACDTCGLYNVPPLPENPQGLRSGVYTLTPPPLTDPTMQHWVVTEYICDGNGQLTKKSYPLPSSGSVDIMLECEDKRVDFCIGTEEDNKRRCNMPVTFTQAGWKTYSNIDNTVIPNGMIYNRFPQAFATFIYFGTTLKNQMVVGKSTKTITFNGTTNGLKKLVAFLPQTGPCGKLDHAYLEPITTSAGALAGETVALLLNIAYNDRRLMPRTPGYDLEKFTIAMGLFKGKTVGQVLDIANAVLAGDPPTRWGLPKDPNDPADTGCKALVAILQAINGNYEFIDMNTFVDNGYLIPNRPFGPTGPGHTPQVPYVP
ncbi:MAG: hypothetical protein M1133_04320 [Armatimonadetes bacterium]|nr:hypothetical protein [Armatimonadota bacterium]